MSLFAATALLWALLIIFSEIWPHKLFNSVILSLALLVTVFDILYLATQDIATSGLIVVIGVFLILLLVPFLLIFNGITMIRNEGRSFANLLSLLLGIVIEIGELAFISDAIFNYGMDVDFFRKASLFLIFTGVSVFYFSFLILLFVLYMIYFQFVPHRNDFEYIIIHGCGLLNGDRVSKLLSNRIDKAIQVFHKGRDQAMIICSGGKGNNETISEAEAIAGYLKEKGISEDHLLLEDRSVSTEENLTFSHEIIKERGGSRKIALVSSNYHIYRCVALAHQLGIPCTGIGARTAFYYWPSAIIREFVAVYANRKNLIRILIGYLFIISPFIYVFLNR